MKAMTKEQAKALEAITKWQDATLPGTPEHTRALIAGTMIMTILPLTGDQLSDIDEIINR
ncbi:MAG: hypothetical protein KCHDKBKB_00679 [Elusimicrobia bacterium]|nr:hypothetical protein [Elusimicrobiota bacterium]